MSSSLPIKNAKIIKITETRFKQISNFDLDLSIFPIANDKISQVETDKKKSKDFSEVFTPLWLVDEMIAEYKFAHENVKTLDLCAGYGQFSIRLMRYLYNNFPEWNAAKFLKENHAFSELQLSSCYKLLKTFSCDITLFIGDSTHLNKLPDHAVGIWCYIESFGYWVCLTKTIKKIMSPSGIKAKSATENDFVATLDEIIKRLDKEYSYMSEKAKDLKTASARLEFISLMNRETYSLQKVDTPVSTINDMIDQVDSLEKKLILVLYNCEIVEQLINKYKIDPSKLTFGIDEGGSMRAKAMQKMYGVDVKLFGNDPLSIRKAFIGRKFDVCFSNPPYNRGLDLKILRSLMGSGSVESSIAREYIFVHPSTWLLDQKNKSDLFVSVKELVSDKLRSVKLFNGNAVFGIGLFVPSSITYIDINYDKDEINVILFDDYFIVNSINDITKYGNNWNKLVKPFVNKIKKYIQTTGHVWSHNTTTLDRSKTYCQTAAIRGNVNDVNKASKASNFNRGIVKDDFYTLLKGKDISECKGIREPRLDKPGGATPTFGFDTNIERDNFLHYLNTDFARFCLSVYKIGQHLENGEMELIPWLDFTQRWDDEKLFNHFDVNKDTQDYIRKFLPDYYGIRG